MLDAAIDGAVDAHALQPLGDLHLDALHEAVVGILVLGQVVHDLVVALGIEVLEGQVLQLPLELLHAEAVRQGRVDLHGLGGLGDLLGAGLVLQGAHVVQPVGDLDEDDPDVLAHGHEHLAEILHLLLFGGGVVDPGQLGDALHQLGHGAAKELYQLIEAGVGVLQAVVEQRCQDGVGIQADLHHDLGHGQGMNDIRFAAFAQLLFMLFLRVVVRLVHQGDVGGGGVAGNGAHEGLISRFGSFHFVTCFLSIAF